MNTTTTSGPAENQRGDDRFLVSVHSTLHGLPPNTNARVADLSCGGARLEHRPDQAWEAPTNSTIVVEIAREDADPLRLFALPVWTTPYAFGVKFLLLDDMDRLALAELIDEHRLAA